MVARWLDRRRWEQWKERSVMTTLLVKVVNGLLPFGCYSEICTLWREESRPSFGRCLNIDFVCMWLYRGLRRTTGGAQTMASILSVRVHVVYVVASSCVREDGCDARTLSSKFSPAGLSLFFGPNTVPASMLLLLLLLLLLPTHFSGSFGYPLHFISVLSLSLPLFSRLPLSSLLHCLRVPYLNPFTRKSCILWNPPCIQWGLRVLVIVGGTCDWILQVSYNDFHKLSS